MNSSDKKPFENSDRWQRLWDIFHEAREKKDSERELYLNDACGSDKSMLQELKELLAAEDEAAGVLEAGRVITKELHLDTVPVAENREAEFSPGKILADRFQIVQQIGQGGMGTVYKAIDLELSRQVALKFLDIDDPRWAKRFLLEARFQARIEHDHICKVYEVGELEGKQYIAMQFIPGRTLLDASSKLKIPEKVRLMQLVCEAVHAAHSIGVIHRDIKPSNILVAKSESGEWIPYVTDFGLARELSAPGITSTGMVMGTAWYMAPEQARGEIRKLDLRCDIHALGATLYEILCGRPPFDGDSSVEVLMKVINEEAPPLRRKNPQVPPDLETIVHKCLQKEPSRRYESAALLAEDLRRFREGEPILARPVTWSHRTFKRVKKYPVIAGLLAAAVILVITLGAIAAWTSWHAQAQAKIANEFEQEIRFMEDTARHAYTEPLHNVRSEEMIVEERLKAIAKRIEDAGSVAEGPGNFAMGRGYMSLYRYPEAKAHLEKAWQEYRIPRVAYSLGLTLGLMYPTEIGRANQIGTKEEREAKKKKIDKEYKQPALQLIKEGNAAIEAPEFVEGLLAYLDKRYEQALSKTQAAFHRQPWFFEAKKLEADILRAMANEHRRNGDTKTASELFKKAEIAYQESVQKGSSYWLAYGSLCALGVDRISMMLYQTGIPDETVYKNSVEACDRSIKINPDKPEAYIAKGALKATWGSYEMQQGIDPTNTLTEAIELQKKALKWDWVRFAAYSNMAASYGDLGVYQRQQGKDASASLNQAVESNRQAVQLNPNNHALRNNLGIALAERANYEERNGNNVNALRDEAIKQFQESARIEPEFQNAYDSLGVIYVDKARSEFEQGADPRASLESSVKYLTKAIAVNPSFFLSYNNLGENYKLQARYAMESGSNPVTFLNQASENFNKGIKANQNNIAGFIGLGSTHQIRAEFLLRQKGDAYPYLHAGREALKKAEALAPNHPDLYKPKAEIEMTSARINLAEGMNKDAANAIQQGMENINKALVNNNRDAEAHIIKAELLLLQAKSSPTPAQSAYEAEKSFQEALRLNSRLARKYATSLQEAKKLSE